MAAPVVPTNNLLCGKGEDFYPQFIVGCKIKTSAVAVGGNSTIETETAHGFNNGDTVYIDSHVGSTPSIDNTTTGYRVTVIDATHFSIPVNVTVAGQFGTCNNIVGDITGQTIQGFVKIVDTQASPTLTTNGTVVGKHTFKLPFLSADTQTMLTSTTYLMDAWRVDVNNYMRYTKGNWTIETERQFQTP